MSNSSKSIPMGKGLERLQRKKLNLKMRKISLRSNFSRLSMEIAVVGKTVDHSLLSLSLATKTLW